MGTHGKEKSGGIIINGTSIIGFMGWPEDPVPIYCSNKEPVAETTMDLAVMPIFPITNRNFMKISHRSINFVRPQNCIYFYLENVSCGKNWSKNRCSFKVPKTIGPNRFARLSKTEFKDLHRRFFIDELRATTVNNKIRAWISFPNVTIPRS